MWTSSVLWWISSISKAFLTLLTLICNHCRQQGFQPTKHFHTPHYTCKSATEVHIQGTSRSWICLYTWDHIQEVTQNFFSISSNKQWCWYKQCVKHCKGVILDRCVDVGHCTVQIVQQHTKKWQHSRHGYLDKNIKSVHRVVYHLILTYVNFTFFLGDQELS